MKRFFLLAITFSILTLGSLASVSAQSSGGSNLSPQQVDTCLEEAASVMGVPKSQVETLYNQGEIVLEDQGNDTTAVKTSGGGHTIAILENIF